MSHFENGPLAGYNSLTDPHLAAYFTSRRIRRHLCQSGLITPDGHVVSENTYHYNCARQEHQRQVREMIAQAIVHKALDMERMRQACFRQELERHNRLQTVQRVRDEKRRRDEGILPFLTSRATSASPRRRSAVHRRDSKPRSGQFRHEAKRSQSAERHHNHQQQQQQQHHNRRFHDQHQHNQHDENRKREVGSENEFSDQSYESDEEWQRSKAKKRSNDEHGERHEFKSERWSTMPVRHQSPYNRSFVGMVPGPPRDRPKSSAPCGYQRSQKSKMKSRPQTAHEPATEQSKCRVRMHYIGSSVPRFAGFLDKGDQVMVEQQPFGAGSLFVFKDMVKPDSDFEFISQRSQEFPFSLTFYVNGQAECRLSTCCEFKRKPGSLIGGVSKAHFRLRSVTGGAPCFRCFQDSHKEDGSHGQRKIKKNKKELTKSKKSDKDKEAGTKKSPNDTSNNSKTPAPAKPVKTVKKKTNVVLAKEKSSEHDERLKRDSDDERGSEVRSRKSSVTSHSSKSSESKSSNASHKSFDSGKKRSSRNGRSSSSESEEERNNGTDRETDVDSKSDSGDNEQAAKKTKKKTKRNNRTGYLPDKRKSGHISFNPVLQKNSVDNDTYSNGKDADSSQGNLDYKKSKEISSNKSLEASDDESRKSNKNKDRDLMESSSSSSSDSESGQDSLEHRKNNQEENIHGKERNSNISDHKDKKKSDDNDRASNKGNDQEQLESSSSSSDSETELEAPDHTIQENEKERVTPDRSILYDRKDLEMHSISHDTKNVQNMDNENERENSLRKVSEVHKGSESDSSSSSEDDSPNRVQADMQTRTGKDGSNYKEDEMKEGKNRGDNNSDEENTDAGQKESFSNERDGNNKNIGKMHQSDTKDVECDNKNNFSKSSSRENSSPRKESGLKGSSHSLRSANAKLHGEKIDKSVSEQRDRASPKTEEEKRTENDDSCDDEDKKEGSLKRPSAESSHEGENGKAKSAAVEFKELLGNIEKYYVKEAEDFEKELKEQKTASVTKSVKDADKISQKSLVDKDDASDSGESSDDDISIGKEDLERAEIGSYKGDDDQKGSSTLHLSAAQKH